MRKYHTYRITYYHANVAYILWIWDGDGCEGNAMVEGCAFVHVHGLLSGSPNGVMVRV